MPTTASDVLMALVRATAALGISAVVAAGLLRWLKPGSPRLHQLVWFLVLLQGVVLLRLPIEIPWYPAPIVRSVAPAFFVPSDTSSRVPADVRPPAPNAIAWPAVMSCLWLAGCGVTLLRWGIAWRRVARQRVSPTMPRDEWVAEWRALLQRERVRTAIPLCITDDSGPALVWRLHGVAVQVPRALWEKLTATQRHAILRHELAHYQHGDLWKGAFFRLLALPHWFNPLAWWVLKNLESCAEWRCDDAATGRDHAVATAYAEVLLLLGTKSPRGTAAMAMQGGRLHGRLRRILQGEARDASALQRLLVAVIPLLLLGAHLVRIQLVAAAPETEAAEKSPAAVEVPTEFVPSAEWKAVSALDRPTEVHFVDLPIEDGLMYLRDYHNISIRIDREALSAAAISLDSPITLRSKQETFVRVMESILEPLSLDWNIDAEGLFISTRVAIIPARRARLEQLLEREIELLDLFSKVSDDVKSSAREAGKKDIQRVLDSLEYARSKFRLAGLDVRQAADASAEIERLKRQCWPGVTGNWPWFQEALSKVLSADQAARYRPVRTVSQAGGQIHAAVDGGELRLWFLLAGLPFTDEQLAQLVGAPNVEQLSLTGTKVSDAGMKYLADMNKLQVLGLGSTRVGDAGVIHLRGLTNLRTLRLDGTLITDVGLAEMKGMSSLIYLDVSGTRVAGSGLVHLQGLTNLTSLDLNATKLGRGELVHLKGMAQLRFLSLSDSDVSDADLEVIGGLDGLTMLMLSKTNITDTGLVQLRNLKNLALLRLSDTAITDAGVKELAGLANLKRLDLDGTKITDAGLKSLLSLSQLSGIDVRGTAVTDAGVAKLRQALPNVAVFK